MAYYAHRPTYSVHVMTSLELHPIGLKPVQSFKAEQISLLFLRSQKNIVLISIVNTSKI